MAAQDKAKGKYQGNTYGGGGLSDFHKLQEKADYEYMGVHRSAPNPMLKTEGEAGSTHDGHEMSRNETGFDLHSKAYAGPQNWQPTNEGVVNETPGGNAPKK